ncbi:MAG: DNA-directed RNA polymerase subunit omega [Chitinivibrionales bacterium]|nr:DNA-directed RNA polymerase subunit omega [Chitinivibrionales bacterium]
MADELLELELDKLENRGISRYKAVVMAAAEARFINDQKRLGISMTGEKPATAALRKLFENRIVEMSEPEATA